MSFETELLQFSSMLTETRDSAHDLWTWLPSYSKARKCLGDYATDVTPSAANVMLEAIEYISDKCDPTEEKLMTCEIYECPCKGNCPKPKIVKSTCKN